MICQVWIIELICLPYTMIKSYKRSQGPPLNFYKLKYRFYRLNVVNIFSKMTPRIQKGHTKSKSDTKYRLLRPNMSIKTSYKIVRHIHFMCYAWILCCIWTHWKFWHSNMHVCYCSCHICIQIDYIRAVKPIYIPSLQAGHIDCMLLALKSSKKSLNKGYRFVEKLSKSQYLSPSIA